ncbi:MAG: RNA pseudouridine synthase [Hyphomicrobiales bacterium]|nr:RNA pseudouridine synthase [Hyphomicrobiales bacterium]MBV9054682.1 RNA pseudouridine synthase [Hyphomicrobiales bacterium]MBV9974362.1 RNA pseudouridine synthase [Hyphomicrobiales bacterium]
MTSEELLGRILYRDALAIVLDKPAGMPVHAGPRNSSERNGDGSVPLTSLFDDLRFGLPRRPELAHRLDRDTSGCLVLGRNRAALERLGKLFQSGKVLKTYWAVVASGPGEEKAEGVIDLPLGRRDPSRGWWMKVDPEGVAAVTRWRVIGRAPERDGSPALTALALEPVTGRTHQLRVHCAAMGWPIIGDSVYGGAPRSAEPGLHLHARALELPLYPNRDAIRAVAPIPERMRRNLAACGIRDAAPG